MAYDREPQPEPAMRPRGGVVRLTEALEDGREKPGLDALSLVPDGDDHLGTGAADTQHHAATRRRELHGVREEVPHHLLETSRVSLHLVPDRVEHGLQLDPLCLGYDTNRVERRLADVGAGDRTELEDELPRHDARPVQEILDELR